MSSGLDPHQEMDRRTITPTALLTALALTQEHAGAAAALRVNGLDLNELERVDRLLEDFRRQTGQAEGEALGDALAVGFMAGRLAHRPRHPRSIDPSSFLMDHDLLVRGAEGGSILRLPWFEEGLFVGRPVPDIAEMPAHVRDLCVEHYRAGLAGERRCFAFSSYGHAYRVDAVPVHGDDGRVAAVLGIAHPAPRPTRDPKPGELTAREVEILQLAADGMSGPEIAEHLVLSPATVKTHFQNVYLKWKVSDRASAVAKALRQRA